ncbi:MAG: hypothetical protein IPL19_30225 [Sandaracinaceae bacterium]|nr:hypothetical protein [Sandaracinaceae bacterium]
MVIEGPPGTGKSQTIANLIAAALGAGKSVLFVADKLTALEVVSRRLDSHGLGIFCLELHSDKTQKSRMMDDIRRRLEARGTFSEPLQLKERLQLLQSARSELNAYARKMNLSFGAMGWTIHDILWGTERRRAQMRASAEPWAGVVLVDAHKLTPQAYEALRATASTFSKVTAAVRPGNAPLENHPFFGVWPTDPRPDWEERILRALQALLQESSHAVASLARVRSQLGDSVPGDASVLSSWASRTLVLGQLGEGAVVGAARLLATDEDRRALAGWCHGVKEYRTRLELVHAQVPDPAARASLMAGAEVLGRLPFEAKLATISEIPVVVAVLRSKLAIADELLTSFSDWLGDLALPRTLEALMLACEVLATLTTVPLDALAFRTALDDDAAFVLEDAVRRSTELATERRALAEAFHLDLLPEDAAVLDAHAATCATAGLFSFLSPEYRAARRQFKILGGVAASDAQRAVGFRALASYQHKLKAFTQDPAIQRVMGAGFRGLDTNFQAVAQARSWQERMMVLARRYRSLSSRLRGMAIAPLDELRELADLGCGASVDVLALRAEVFSALSLKLDASASVQQPLSELLASLDDVVSLCAPVAALARQVWAPSDATVGALISLHTALLQLAEHHDALLIDPHARRALGPSFSFPNTAIDVVDRTVHFAFELWSPDTPAPVRVWFIGDASTANLHDVHQMLAAASQAIQAMNSAEQAFVATGSLLGDHWYRTSGGVRASREPQILHARAKWAFEEREQLSPWLAYLRARAALWSAGGDQLRVVVETDSRVDTSNIDKVAELVVFASLAKQVFDEHPDLRRHEGFAHTTLREKFCEYDTQIMKLHEAQLASRIDARHIPEGVKGAVVKNRTELALLSHELSKQRAHIPIRQLVNRAGGALRGIKPCFMMSPRSVAQYLEAGRHDFDIVIMDEASQLRPEDAIGAIARGRQAVIVGDSRQLPPTSFFTGTGVNEDDEEEFVVETKESILDLAKTAYRPVRQLRWHYRSKHESLIAFSNHQYYDSNLVVFPSPSNGSDELGVKYIEVPDGVCVGGVNDVEARIVVDAVMDHLMTRASESFGIVAMNVKQKERIQILLDERLRDHQELRKIFEEDDGERQGAFIKNLESVQGDERDVIYISVTYGPKTPGGRVARTFGPLNGPNGWRRLNVLFTRARRRVVVFSSFAPEALGDEAALSRGASDLKKYLTFARTGRYLAAKTTDREPDSDFEVSVADALRDAGFVVVPQVGVAGYFIDLAVKHPQRPSEFILGVECDGAAYHSSFSARDRDRLRQQVLEGLHWKIHRIWSTDWFRDPRGQRRRLIEVLRALE